MSESRSETLDDETMRLRLLVDALDDCAILALDNRGCVARWNRGPRAEPRDEVALMGRHVSTFYPEPDRSAGKPERDLQAAEIDGRFEEEGWRVRSDGTPFWADVTISPLRDSGTLVGFAYVIRDCTRRPGSRSPRPCSARRSTASKTESSRPTSTAKSWFATTPGCGTSRSRATTR